jgi:hypothetical protein
MGMEMNVHHLTKQMRYLPGDVEPARSYEIIQIIAVDMRTIER